MTERPKDNKTTWGARVDKEIEDLAMIVRGQSSATSDWVGC